MKTLKHLLVCGFIVYAPLSFAQVDDSSGFSGSSGGGGFDFTPTTPSDSGSLGGGGSGGGYSANDTATNVADAFGAATQLLNTLAQSNSHAPSGGGGGSSSGGLIAVAPPSPQWSNSVFNAEHNPLVGLLAGSPAQTPYHSTQGFGALLFSKNPLALFVDLNGDGVRGDMMDGILFNMFFPQETYNSEYQVASAKHGRRSVVEQAKRNKKAEKQIKAGLLTTRIALLSPLADGREAASLKELTGIFADEKMTDEDRETALASILNLVTLNPALSTGNGPVLSQVDESVRNRATSLSVSLQQRGLKPGNLGRSVIFHRGGNDLAMAVNMDRLGLVMSLVEARLTQPGARLSDDSLDAVRAALYFTNFEVHRMKVSAEQRSEIIKVLVNLLAESTPNALHAAAEEASSPETLKRLERGLLRVAPVIQTASGPGRLARLSVSALGSAAVIGLWMAGGDFAVEALTNDIAVEALTSTAGYAVLPPVGAMVTNWLMKPSRLSLTNGGVRQGYQNLCELALETK